MRLDGKHVLITGGESGIGLATARLFAAEGASLHLIGLDADALTAAATELPDTTWHWADVTDEEAVKQAVIAGAHHHGRAPTPFDVIFSNAGVTGDVKPIVDYPTEVFTHTLAVHIVGAFHMLKHGLPVMRDGGSFIINSSVSGLVGLPGLSAYAAAKHGQIGLMRSAAREVATRSIRVNTINPGPVSTPFQDRIEMAATGLDQKPAAAVFDELIPLGQHATADDVARLALYLASDDSRMVTSSTLRIDGGMAG